MKTILLVEDHFYLRKNTTEILEFEGYKVISASSGEEGTTLARDMMPDIILCDIMMPGINGFEVLDLLKKNETTSAIPFVFLTSCSEKREIQEGFKRGAVSFITKPFHVNNLINEIKTCLLNAELKLSPI